MSKVDPASTLPRQPPSKVPSWIMLGFVIGALFVWLLKREFAPAVLAPEASNKLESPATPELRPVVLQAPPEGAARIDPPLTTIEAIWAEYGHYAVWQNDITEVAFWNTATSSFRDCFQITRRGDQVYFRSIPRLTWPVIDTPGATRSPIQFTTPPAPRVR